jgi:hypothetical protein
VRLWKGDPTRRLTVILPAGLALDLKIESIKRGVDVSVLAAQALAAYLDSQAALPPPAPPAPVRTEPPVQSIRRQAEAARRGLELAALLKAAFASGQVTLAEFSRHLARAIGHPNPVGLSSAVRQWKRVPDLHQGPVEVLLVQLGVDTGSLPPGPDPRPAGDPATSRPRGRHP